MNLQFLVISDTHLGEETSLLCFPHGRRRLWSALCDLFGGGHRGVHVEELILLGDIPDRTLSSTSQIITHTNAFMETLGSALDVRRAVYVPGNHDHTIWSSYLRAARGADAGVTAVDGEPLVTAGQLAAPASGGAADALLSLFFGYPDGSSWRAIDAERKLDFLVANPIYARAFAGRTYVFTHGTHFRMDVCTPVWLKALLDAVAIDELLAQIEIQPGGDVAKAKDLADLEARVTPFVDSLWPSSGSNPTSSSDQLWYLLTYISGKFGQRRAAPLQHAVFDRAALAALGEGDRVKNLTPEHDLAAAEIHAVPRYANGSIDRMRRLFLPHALGEARRAGLAGPVTFVYGDTHEGGYGRLPDPGGDGDVRVYNTGAWVVHSERHHPPCHLFAVDEDGNEHLADLTFGGVTVDGRALLDLAAEDAENRRRATSRALRAILSLVPTPA